jgi:multiple sugar transport system substrate-binding protein
MTRKQNLIIIGGALVIVIVLIIIGFIKPKPQKPVTLEVWGAFDEKEALQELIGDYQKANKYVSINYEKKSFAEYEKELINAFAGDKGPDIWLIHNAWLPKHKDKIRELPVEFLAFRTFKEIFVDVVEKDLSEDNKIYALPLYVDTLALFYNRDFFNTAGIVSPPETWEELIDDLDELIKRNQWGGIERAGVALGTAENINRSTDILGLLMLQNGTEMIGENKKSATFDKAIYLEGQRYYPGQDALRFYTDFSNPSKKNYTWNRQMPYSLDAFAEGKVAIIFGYSHHISSIKAKAPYLNFSIASMPQIKDRQFDINYANYWAFTVSKKSRAADEAWRFILYLTGKRAAKKYLEKNRRPTARRDLLNWQKQDLEMEVFVNQVLTARNWYQIDSDAIETIFADDIQSVVLGSITVERAIKRAVDQVTLLMK